MTQVDEVRHYADVIMIMIREDQDTGQVPDDVSSWDELDESVDLDDYCRRARLPSGTHEANALQTAVSDEVNRRLTRSQGGPWSVTWTSPAGLAHAISRAIGYASRAEADVVGRDYCAVHGGRYQVQDG